ncbi:hypothetical protein L6452_16513 [Arctium lappa]|uniref:Uncharacterized protein n=1 Tax=Arctium lappa TaxID=4217 RepID=A0ACB9C0Q3_ARCLA|nr:hypothetical protein L6452_16513 [Arctium lappa]
MIHCDIKHNNVLLDAHFVVISVISGWQDFLIIFLQATPVQFSWSKRNNRICGSWFELVSVFGQELFLVSRKLRFGKQCLLSPVVCLQDCLQENFPFYEDYFHRTH